MVSRAALLMVGGVLVAALGLLLETHVGGWVPVVLYLGAGILWVAGVIHAFGHALHGLSRRRR